ncbi:NAD-dependent epimerase/dehydratase family protein [Silanimonas sp.]|jgi:UDP-glucose 4-epimerase|uniref:NAD-dependent epimerase/dehydratase family protein n=1 Tax=Silanimonas sp. TaxID=1929290 RepID=UPI0037C9B68D
MRVLLTGGNGFIGSHVVEALRAAGHHVVVLDIGEQRPDLDWSGVTYVRGSFLDEATLDGALAGVDCVVHAASTSVPATSMRDPVGDVEQNLVGTLRVALGMVRHGVRRIVYLSSGGTVYGVTGSTPVHEDHPCRPISGYGVVKLACEHYLRVFSKVHGFSFLALRASNPYGPRQAASGVQGLVGTTIHRLRQGVPIDVRGDGSAVRDYVYIRDLAVAVSSAVTSPACGVMNIGSGVGLSVREVIEAVAGAMGVAAEMNFEPASPSDVPRIVLDCSKASTGLSWTATTSFDTGIRATLAHAATKSPL